MVTIEVSLLEKISRIGSMEKLEITYFLKYYNGTTFVLSHYSTIAIFV